ncbi:MAG: L-2-amino-thiazoline-4-carboxylic acid hydrolase [Pseudomonadota bacterium]
MTDATDPTLSPIFRQRAVEATILRHVYNTLVASHGEAVAERTIADAVRAASIEQAEGMADEVRAKGDEPSMRSFQQLYELWSRGGALEVEVLEETDTTFDFDVTRCRYSEMYKEMGLGKIGHLLSCQRDGTFCEGYDPRIKMERSQTIMGGADRCTFRYRLED